MYMHVRQVVYYASYVSFLLFLRQAVRSGLRITIMMLCRYYRTIDQNKGKK